MRASSHGVLCVVRRNRRAVLLVALAIFTVSGLEAQSSPPDVPCINSWGDVHILTLDKMAYDFQAAGDFILAQDHAAATLKESERWVVVQARQKTSSRNPNVSYNTAVAMRVGIHTTDSGDQPNFVSDRVEIYLDNPPKLYVNGTATTLAPNSSKTLPNTGGHGGQVFRNAGGKYTVKWPSNFSLSACVYASHIDIGAKTRRLDIDGSPTENFEGLWGNFNEDKHDDMKTRGGKQLTLPLSFEQLYKELGPSWCVPSAESLFKAGVPAPPCTYPSKAVKFADLTPQQQQNAKNACKDIADNPIPYQNCLLDVGATQNQAFADGAKAVATSWPPSVVQGDQGPTLVGQWIFIGPNGSLEEQTGNWQPATTQGTAKLDASGLKVSQGRWARAEGYSGPEITEKTLIAWVVFNDLANPKPAGAAISLDALTEDKFDAIVYGENTPNAWMAGSTKHQRSNTQTNDNLKTTSTNQCVKMAITYQLAGNGDKANIRIFKDDELALGYTANSPLVSWTKGNAEVFFGTRHTLPGGGALGFLDATILGGEIHNTVLTAEQLQARPILCPCAPGYQLVENQENGQTECYLKAYSSGASCNCDRYEYDVIWDPSCSGRDGSCGGGWIAHCHGACALGGKYGSCNSDCKVNLGIEVPLGKARHLVCGLDGQWYPLAEFTLYPPDPGNFTFNSGKGAGSKNPYSCSIP